MKKQKKKTKKKLVYFFKKTDIKITVFVKNFFILIDELGLLINQIKYLSYEIMKNYRSGVSYSSFCY